MSRLVPRPSDGLSAHPPVLLVPGLMGRDAAALELEVSRLREELAQKNQVLSQTKKFIDSYLSKK